MKEQIVQRSQGSQLLNGIWHYTPIARVAIVEDGTWKTESDNLPSPGEMNLPAHWERSGLTGFFGTVRFERTFTSPPRQAGESLWLICRGCDYFATVRINDQLVGSHEGYFQTWEFDVTPYLHEGENSLAIDVTSPLEEPGTVWFNHKRVLKGILNHWDCRPGSWDLETGQDIHSGGIWNDLLLEVRPAIFIENVKTQTRLTPPDEALSQKLFSDNPIETTEFVARVIITTQLYVQSREHAFTQKDDPLELEVQIGEHTTRTRVEPALLHSSTIETALTIPHPRLWWTWDHGEPDMYPCSVRLLQGEQHIDSYQQMIGLREITLDEQTGIWTLNKRRIFIRGTNIVPTLWLGEYSQQRIEHDIALLKEAHINGVRVCVHVNREELYDALDRAGILVWQDFALQWSYRQSDDFIAEAVRQIKDMVRQLRHHPSIALWCCQNESTQFNHDVLDPVLAQAAREEDSSHYVRPTSEFQEHVYHGWYYGTTNDYHQAPTASILSEFGAQALPSVAEMEQMVGTAWPPDWKRMAYHDFQYDQTFHVAHIDMGNNMEEFVASSQNYQALLLKIAIERFRRAKYQPVGSLFQFMFMDCWPSITWSILSYDRVPKAGYRTLQQVYQPVLVGATIRRDSWTIDRNDHSNNSGLLPWIVNDLPIELTDVSLQITLQSKAQQQEITLATLPCAAIAADSVVNLSYTNLTLPAHLSPGAYILELHLLQSERVLSTNTYTIQLVYQNNEQ